MWHSVANGGSRIGVDEGRSQLTKKEGAGLPLLRMWLKERQRLSLEYSTFCLRTMDFTDTLEVVKAVRRLHRMEERQSHKMTNAESESERSSREP